MAGTLVMKPRARFCGLAIPMPLIGAALVVLTATCDSLAGWVAAIHPDHLVDPGMASIRYVEERNEGHETLGQALDHLAGQGRVDRLRWIMIHPMLRDAGFQKELLEILGKSAPALLEAALKSGGGGNHPKVRRLYRPFMDAVLMTTTGRMIVAELSARGIRVAEVSGEKFRLMRTDEGMRFAGGLVLEIARGKSPDEAPGKSSPGTRP